MPQLGPAVQLNNTYQWDWEQDLCWGGTATSEGLWTSTLGLKGGETTMTGCHIAINRCQFGQRLLCLKEEGRIQAYISTRGNHSHKADGIHDTEEGITNTSHCEDHYTPRGLTLGQDQESHYRWRFKKQLRTKRHRDQWTSENYHLYLRNFK